MSKPLILVTNDDGITAPGIKNLIEIAKRLGEVVVVAPDSPQSGQGHAITIASPIRLHKTDIFDGVEAYECSGTPVDCVKLGKNVVLAGRKIDLCLSGINHGSNASLNILYSGTMSAAMEACLEEVDSIGFSLCDFQHNADFEGAAHYAYEIASQVLENGMPDNCKLLNVNIPKLPKDEIKGIRICKQAKGRWVEDFVENQDPRGVSYYWLTGKYVHQDSATNSDIKALADGYVSVVPSGYDLTVYQSMDEFMYLEQ